MRYLLLGGMITLAISFYWPKYLASLKMKQAEVLATVVSSRGSNEWVSKKSLTHQSPRKALSIRMNESLATGTDGEMVIRFKKGAEIRLLPSSFITLIRKANSTLIALRKGELEVVREGELNSVLVSQGGQDKPLQDYHAPLSDSTLWIDTQSLDTINNKPMKSVTPIMTSTIAAGIEGSGGMTPLSLVNSPFSAVTEKQVKDFETQVRAMISDRISRQKNHLFRCYSTLVEKKNSKLNTPEGKVNLHFTVNNQGKVEDLLFLNSEISDQKFKNCLSQVIKRTEFQPFQGTKISTMLPLRFDRNLE